jgi:hypothetical protein
LAKPTQASTKLTESLAAQESDVNELILDFDFWKALSGDQETDIFGRDGANLGSTFFRHVHMIPFNDASALALWNYNFQNSRGKTSNRYLFYVDGGAAYGYLLLTVIDDPVTPGAEGAHDIWKPHNADLLAELNRLADEFYHRGIVP